MVMLKKSSSDGPVKVGIDVTGLDWHYLINTWKSYNDEGFDIDYKNWDGGLEGSTFHMMAEVANNWYREKDPEVRRIRQILASMECHSWVVVGNKLVKKHQGLPSGAAITTEGNCIINLIYNIYVYYCLREHFATLDPKIEKSLYPTISEFFDYVSIAVYGDDLVIVPRADIAYWYTPTNVSAILKAIGFEVTAAVKTDAIGWKPIEDLQFLKCTTKRCEGYYISALEKDSIEQQSNFVHVNPLITDEMLLSVNFQTMLRQAWRHGKVYYNDVKTRISAWCEQNDMAFPIEEYELLKADQLYANTGEERFKRIVHKLTEDVIPKS